MEYGTMGVTVYRVQYTPTKGATTMNLRPKGPKKIPVILTAFVYGLIRM